MLSRGGDGVSIERAFRASAIEDMLIDDSELNADIHASNEYRAHLSPSWRDGLSMQPKTPKPVRSEREIRRQGEYTVSVDAVAEQLLARLRSGAFARDSRLSRFVLGRPFSGRRGGVGKTELAKVLRQPVTDHLFDFSVTRVRHRVRRLRVELRAADDRNSSRRGGRHSRPRPACARYLRRNFW